MRARIRDTEIYFDVEGASLVAGETGIVERPTAFLVHGGPGLDHTAGKARYQPLSRTMQLVYFDHRGQGRSARGDVDKYVLDENVEDMEALRRHLGLASIVSIGTSYGGMVAMAHAARYPQSVSHLVLVATAAHSGYVERAKEIVGNRGTLQQVAMCEDLFSGRIDTVEKFQLYISVMGSLYSRRPTQAAGTEHTRPILEPIALNKAHGPGGFLRTFDLRPSLRSITAHTLILAARHDWIHAPEFSEEICQNIRGADLRIFENSGHLIAADEPQELVDIIAGFIVHQTEIKHVR